jgi:predicted transcriptional regulator
MIMMNFYHAETIQEQTKNRSTIDVMAALLKVVSRGEGPKKGIENGANLSFSKEQYYPLILITWQTSLK